MIFRYIFLFLLPILFSLPSLATVAAQENPAAEPDAVSVAEATTTDDETTNGTTTETTEVETPTTATVLPLSAVAQTRLTNLTANISNRLDAHARRLDNIINRLDSRSNKIANTSGDTAAALEKLSEARLRLDTATQTLATIDNEVHNFVTSENPLEYWRKLKNTYTGIQFNIQESQRLAAETFLLLVASVDNVHTAPVATSTDVVE